MPGPLKNPKHEAFVRALLEGKSAGDAYQGAGFQSADRGNASRLRLNSKVQERLRELQEEIAAKVPVTIESLIAELEEARTKAAGKNQFAASIKAILGKAQLSGLLVERKKIEVSSGNGLDSAESVEELVAGMVKFFFWQVEYTHNCSPADLDYLREVYAKAFQTIEDATEKLREEILARPLGSVKYRPQALLSAFNGKSDSQRVVTDGE